MGVTKSVTIVGAGVGGIVTSLFLAKKGYEVSVYEKNQFPGGRCGQISRDGHRFDIGATILLMPDLYRKVFRSLDLDFDSEMQCIPIDTLYRLFFEDGKTIDIVTDKTGMKDQVELLEQGSYKKLQSYLASGYGFYNLAFKKLLGRNFYKARDFITPENIRLLFRLKVFTRHSKYIRRFFNDPHLRTAFTFQNIYVGQSPYDASALFSMLPAIELNEGSCFMKGGMHSLVTKLMNLAKESGVKFYFDQPVKQFETSGTRITAIILEDGRQVTSDLYVCNADLPYSYNKFLADQGPAKRINKMRYSCSAIVFHWALSKNYPLLGLHNVIFSDQYKNNLDAIFKYKSLGDQPDFYIYAPERCDPDAAPRGEDTLTVIVPSGHMDPGYPQDWDTITMKARNYILKRLKLIGLKDIDQHIKFEITMKPESWVEHCNVSRGGVFGSLSHNIMQMGYLRPHNRHDRYRNLYFVGGSTHPGSGIPMVLLSAKLVSERIETGE